MTSQQPGLDGSSEPGEEDGGHRAAPALRSMGDLPNAVAGQFDFWDNSYEGRRLFSEVLGTFFLVLVAAGGSMVNARFGGNAIPLFVQVTAPGLMVAAIILFMGTVSGAHLNPGVSIAFAMRGDFPWRRVPAYIVAQFLGAILAMLLLWALIGKHGTAGLTLPGHGISTGIALLWEMVLTVGLVSVILGTASGAQALGPLAAIGVGSYIVLAGLWGALVSGASMNTARSLGPALVLGNWTAWWAYLVGPPAGAIIAVGFAWILRGPGGGSSGTAAGQGTLGTRWRSRRQRERPSPGGPSADSQATEGGRPMTANAHGSGEPAPGRPTAAARAGAVLTSLIQPVTVAMNLRWVRLV
jgi:aquaporin Z